MEEARANFCMIRSSLVDSTMGTKGVVMRVSFRPIVSLEYVLFVGKPANAGEEREPWEAMLDTTEPVIRLTTATVPVKEKVL